MKKTILKSLKEKKEREGKVTTSLCLEKQCKQVVTELAKEIGVSESHVVNEIIRRVLL